MSDKDTSIIQFLKSHGFKRPKATNNYIDRLNRILAHKGLKLDGKWEKIGCHEYYRPFFKQLHSDSKSVIIKVR